MRSLRLVVCASSLAILLGCGSSSTATTDAGAHEAAAETDSGKTGTKDAGHDTGHDTGHDAGHDTGMVTMESGVGDVKTPVDSGDANACGGSVVPEFVTTNLTLTLACSPWHAPLPVFVGDAMNDPLLTIEPGVTVLFASGAYLSIGMDQDTTAPGGLTAVGTAAAPIVLTADAASPTAGAWGGVYFNSTADTTSALSFATVSYAGQEFTPLLNTPIDLGSIYVDAGSMSPLVASTPLHILLSNLTVSHNGGSGIICFGPYAGFASGSGVLTIPDWATGGYPVIIDPNSADTLPSTLTTGTGAQGGIGLIQEDANRGGGGQDILIHDETWPVMPIPYIVDESLYAGGSSAGNCGIFVDGLGTGTNTLTIASPNKVEFQKPAAGGACGIYVSQNVAGGRLIANGTAFTSAEGSAATPGDWTGIAVSADPSGFGTTSFANCSFAYAVGATSGTSPGTSELYFDGFAACGTGGPGTVGPPVTNCTFTDYSGCAVDGLDLTGEAASYGTGTTGTNGDMYTPATGDSSGVCSQTNC